MTDAEWQDDTEPQKQIKRDAADKFLRATLRDAHLREAVVQNPQYAREAFQKFGEITVPDYVQVICLPPERVDRAKLIVFILPPEDTDPEKKELWRDSWASGWQPYK